MKKILFVLVFSLFIGNVKAADFIDTLGAECGRILHNLSQHDYPNVYPNIVKRNTQFDALEKCLSLYKQSGGNILELNNRYHTASSISICAYGTCLEKNTSSESSSNECVAVKRVIFYDVLEMDKCSAYDAYKKMYPNCTVFSVLKNFCEKRS